uniref:BTB domain-containing protein n=1 Tax=Capitella teleta TaxID=283909 RepID=X2B5W4_CAPTE
MVDVRLVFGDRRVPCHRVVLAGTCEYFKRMFLTKMNEQSSEEVTIKEISSMSGVLVVDYLYSRTVNITVDNAQGLLEASSMLLLDELKHKVEEFLVRQIEAQSCVSLLNLARLFELKALIEASLKFLTDNLDKAFDEIEMKELQEEDLVHVLKNHASQRVCFCALQKWVRCTGGDTDQFMALLQHVDLSRCSKQFILTNVLSKELLNCALFCTKNREWRILPSITIGRYLHSSIYHKGHLYIVGGRVSETSCSDSVESLDIESLQWRQLPPLPVHVYLCLMVSVSDRLFVLGGAASKQSSSRTVYEYSASQSSWRCCAPIPGDCHLASATSFHDQVFVIGGYDKSCMVYEPRVDCWGMLQRPQRRHSLGVTLEWNGKIIVLGGEGDDSIEEYCPQTNQW